MARARSLSEFQKACSDEASCVAYLFKRRWPDGFICPGCSERRAAVLKSRPRLTILASVLKRSGVRRAAARRPPECARTARRPHRASDEINPSNRHGHYI